MAKRPVAVGAFLASLLLLASCTDDEASPPPSQASPTAWTAAPAVITRADVQELPANQSNLPVLPTDLPRRAPVENAVLPDLLTNLPGTATMTYHPPESQSDDLGGWPSEDVLFYGADGAWRRLQMEDLGLPKSVWPGGDTFGAGNLSPNGRWWTAPSDAGVMVLSLSTGSTQLIDLSGGYGSPQSGYRTAERSSLVPSNAAVGTRPSR